MKFLGIFFPDWLVIVGILLTIVYWYLTWNFNYLQSRGIRCAPPILFFGNLLTERNKVIREEDIIKAKRYGTVYGFYEGRRPTIRIAEPDLLREILSKQFDNFADRRNIDFGKKSTITKKFLNFINGAEWKQVRNVMTPTFTSGKLKQMGPLIEEAVKDLVEILREKSASKSSIDLKSQFGTLVMDIIATCAFGTRINSQKNPNTPFVERVKHLQAKRNLFKSFILMMIPGFIRKAFNLGLPGLDEQTVHFFKKTIMEIINNRKEKNVVRNDFLQLMLEAQKSEGSDLTDHSNSKKVLTIDGVVAQSILFLLAGFETISTALAIVCYQLTINEEIQEKLSSEIDKAFAENKERLNYEVLQSLPYLEMVLMESLRWFPPGFRTERECVHDAQVGDLKIAKGTLISIPIHAIHHNEEYYPNPKKFDPERFSKDNKKTINQYAFLPFGMGPRNCIGMRFAIMEAKYILAHVVHQFKMLPCPETKEPLQIPPNITSITSAAGAWAKFEKK